MLFNYLKLSFRLMTRNPFFTVINVIGLGIGFATFYVLLTYTKSELASDRYHPDWDRMVRVGTFIEWTDDNKTWESNTWGLSNAILIGHLANTYGEIESFVRIVPQALFKYYGVSPENEISISVVNPDAERKSFREEKVVLADPGLFQFFSIPLLHGHESTALRDTRSILISRSKAIAYFDSENPVGKTLQLNDSLLFSVTGVFEDIPSNSHLNFDIVLSTERLRNEFNERMLMRMALTYAKIRPNVKASDLQMRVNNDSEEFVSYSFWGDWQYGRADVHFQPIDEVAFGHFMGDQHSPKSKTLLTVLQVSAWVVLVMAWVNYIIHAVTFGFKRDKEQNIRRVVGASTTQMAYQFVVESVVVHGIALLGSFTIIQLTQTTLVPIFGFYVPGWQTLALSTQSTIIESVILSIFLTSLFPFLNALFSVKHASRAHTSKRNLYYNTLTSLQMTLAIILVICTFCVYQQNRFILLKGIGLDRANIALITLPPTGAKDFGEKMRNFITQIKGLTGVVSATVSHSAAGNNFENLIGLQRIGSDGGGLMVESDGGVDANFVPFYNISLLNGRNFIEDNPADSGTIILSVAAARRLGFENPEEAVGQKIAAGDIAGGENIEIIGIINDYQMRPLINGVHGDAAYNGAPGLALTYKNFAFNDPNLKTVSVKISPGNEHSVVEEIRKIHKAIFPTDTEFFRLNFMDEKIEDQYKNYRTLLSQITLFAILAISVAVAGLAGVFARKVVVRVKEIGIRKVLGARSINICGLLVSSTFRQFVIATSIGIFTSWMLIQKYQQEFTEKSEMSIWNYLLPAFIFAIVIGVTITSTIWKALNANPVEALKYE